jgi:hypothetical protein
MHYLDQERKIVYTSKDGRTSKNFPALELLAAHLRPSVYVFPHSEQGRVNGMVLQISEHC